MTVYSPEGALKAVLDAATITGDPETHRADAGPDSQVPDDAVFPYFLIRGDQPSTPALKGDAVTLAEDVSIQLDFWTKAADPAGDDSNDPDLFDLQKHEIWWAIDGTTGTIPQADGIVGERKVRFAVDSRTEAPRDADERDAGLAHLVFFVTATILESRPAPT